MAHITYSVKLARRLGGPQSRSERSSEEKNSHKDKGNEYSSMRREALKMSPNN
jgi:hypothetical protein